MEWVFVLSVLCIFENLNNLEHEVLGFIKSCQYSVKINLNIL